MPQGWYADPLGEHQERRISDGRLTRLIRDDGIASEGRGIGDAAAVPVPDADLHELASAPAAEVSVGPHRRLRAWSLTLLFLTSVVVLSLAGQSGFAGVIGLSGLAFASYRAWRWDVRARAAGREDVHYWQRDTR